MDRYRGSPPLRDRPPVRYRDDHPDVEYFGQGESYRPGGSTGEGPYRPSHRDRASESWSTERRDDRRREEIDSYIPPTSNRAQQRTRSRTPDGSRRRSPSPYARTKELFPDSRPRSPARRYSPRREVRDHSNARRRSRSPPYTRTRSPEPRRPRDDSPDGRRSPKRALNSPRGRYDRARSPLGRTHSPVREPDRYLYRPRSRSATRAGVKQPFSDDTWRRSSPSARPSGPASSNTSRRSSPPAYQDRSQFAASSARSPAHANSYNNRSPSTYGERPGDLSQPSSARDPIAPPIGPASQRIGHDRAPPTGPFRSYGSSVASTSITSPAGPPTGPASQSSVSLHNRVGPHITPPTHPRAVPPGRYASIQRDFTNQSLRGRGGLTHRAPSTRPTPYQETGPPSGPRASSFGASRTDYPPGRGNYPPYARGDHSYTATFRAATNTSSTTYPRSQRFNATPTSTPQTYLHTLEKIVPGGKKLPSGLAPDVDRRLQTLQTDAEKLRSMIEEKQKAKREAVNEWETRERESGRETLRGELAEQALAKLMEGEESTAGAAF